MKKIISLLMALIFVFSMATPSFAAAAANEAVVAQSSDLDDDLVSGTLDMLGGVVDFIGAIWNRIVDFFKSIFGFGSQAGTYNVIYYYDETKTTVYLEVPTAEGEEIKDVAIPSKKGYTFKCWTPTPPSIMPDEDVVVYATWSIKTFTVKFNTGVDGVKLDDVKTDYNSVVELPELGEVDNRVLVGWKTPLGELIEMPGGEIVVTDNVTLTAVWGVKRTTLTFDPNGGYWNENPADNGIYKIKQEPGKKVDAPANPTRAGYKFEGWDGVVPVNQPADDVTFTAVWMPLDITTTWKINGQVVGTQVTKAGSNLSPKVTATPPAGYTFDGWKSSADNVIYRSFPISTPSVDSTFTAEFKPLSYTYSFKEADGTVISSGSAFCGSDIRVPAAAAKTGYVFAGWKDSAGAILEVNAETNTAKMPGNNVVYTATYTPNVHTITWDANGGTVNNKAVDTTTVAFDSAIDAPQAVKTGYVFAGWTPTVPATMPDNDLAFVATWNAAGDTKYTVETYTMGLDGEYAVASEAKTGVTDSTVTVAPAAKEGFTLNETKSVLEGVVAPNGSTVLKVYYDRNKYNVTVGETTTEYYFGATFKAPAAVEKEGNTFKGWKGTDGKLYAADSDVTVPAIDNFELVAEFEVNEYTVTFKYTENGEDYIVWYTGKVAYGAEIVAPAAPTIENKYFEGWNIVKEATEAEALPASMPANDLTFYAIFVANEEPLTVTFNANGGKFPDKTTTTVRNVYRGQPINLPKDAPTKANMRFAGWALDKDSTETVVIGNMTYATDVTFYAVFVPITCEIKYLYKDVDGVIKTYADEDGAETLVITLEKSTDTAEVAKPEMAKEKGYQFGGWSLAKVNGEDVVPNEDGTIANEFVVTKDDYTREYYAEYVINKNTVKFVGNASCNWGKEVVDETTGEETVILEKTEEIEFGKDIIAPAAPTVIGEGLAFFGWSADNGKTILPEGAKLGTVGAEETYTDDTVYEFKAVYGLDKFIIDYYYEGKIVNSQVLAFGDSVEPYVLTAEQENPGLILTGWTALPESITIETYQNSARDNDRNAYVINTYATTESKEFTIKFVNCFKDPIVVKYNEEIDAEAANSAPEATEGYTFAGWLGADGELYEFPEVMGAEDIVVTAKWLINSHNVTWVVNGETIEKTTYEYDAVIVKPADPEIEGYTFKGWDKAVPATMPDEALTFTAIFEINTYDVTWVVDGVETTETYEYKAIINKLADPVKTGYTFIGWEGYADEMIVPSHNVTFTALWEINTYTVSWIVDGVETVETYEYGKDIVVPADPEKEGYEFTGWTPAVAGVMGVENLAYTATFKACEYDVTFVSGEEYGDASVTVKVPYGELVADYAPKAFEDATNTEGKYIVGWAELEEGFTMPVPAEEEEFIYTAVWGTESYVFNFVYGEGENDVISVEAEFGEEIAEFEAPAKDGYEFIGWFDAEGNEVTLPMAVENDYGENGEEVEFAAEWNALPFKAKFNANGGDFGEATDEEGNPFIKKVETKEVLCDDAIELPADPVRKGYTFKGWAGYSEDMTMPAEDVEFLAVWKVNVYNVTFKYGGGKDSAGDTSKTIEVQFGEEIVAPTDVTYAGYTFSQWSPILEENKVLDVESDLEFTAIWLANTDTKYTVNVYVMDLEGNYGEPTVTVKAGETNTIGKAVEGEDFVVDEGFVIDAVKSTDDLSATITADNNAVINVYIARKSFAVYTEVEGVQTKLGDYLYGQTVAEPAAAEAKEGYDFAWDGFENGAIVVEDELVIKGAYTAKTYTITIADAGKDKAYSFTYGAEVEIPDPTRDGYTFKGWDKELPETMPAKDLVITALWEKVTEEA